MTVQVTAGTRGTDGPEVRIGFLSAYFSMYDAQMEQDFKVDQLRWARTSLDALSQHFAVTSAGTLEGESDGERAASQLQLLDPDCIVYAPVMVAPAAWAMRALAATTAPVVIWNALQVSEMPATLTHAESTANTSTVGCLMLANLLTRLGRRFSVVTTAATDPTGMERLVRTVRAAATATRLRKSRFLRIGGVIPGYEDVEASDVELDRLGVSGLSIDPDSFDHYVRSSSSTSHEDLDPPVTDWARKHGGDERSLGLSDALCRLVRDHGAAGGAVNCHGAYFRDNKAVGIPACLAVSILATQGIPFACTGDLPAGIALFLAQSLSGRSQYCEFYTPDFAAGQVLLAAGGEGDVAWAAAGSLRVAPNELYPGVNGAGAGVSFAFTPGRATLLSLSPTPESWRLTWATGEIVARSHHDMGGPNGYFRFDTQPVEQATSDWIHAGSTHHHALASGDLDIEIPVLAECLAIEAVRV